MDSASAFATDPQATAGLGNFMPQMAQQAQQLQGYGRNGDSMLVHMTPGEVNSLQGLAMAAGGSLTINPETGLPEASFLKKLLPMLAGLGLNFFLPGVGMAIGKTLGGIGAAAGTGVAVGAGTAAITGDLSAGLSAGLGAFGGASLAGGVKGLAGTAAKNTVPGAVPGAVPGGGTSILQGGTQALTATPVPAAVPPIGEPSSFLGRFADTARGGMGGLAGKAAPYMAGMGVLGSLQPTPGQPKAEKEEPGSSQYTSAPRRQLAVEPRRAPGTEFDPTNFDSSQRRYFSPSRADVIGPDGQVFIPGTMDRVAPAAPVAGAQMPSFLQRMTQAGYQNPFQRSVWNTFAEGGEVRMDDGSFVVDARTVSELGNGSSEAGQELLARMGGRPIKGSGDGVSDSIPARIGGTQEARVARDEVVFSPGAVRRVGGGSEKRGTQKLYAMMERAHKARKQAERGQDTKLRRGLA